MFNKAFYIKSWIMIKQYLRVFLKHDIVHHMIQAEWLSGDNSVDQAVQTREIQSLLHSLLTTGTHFTEQWPGFPKLASTLRPRSRCKGFLALYKHQDIMDTTLAHGSVRISHLLVEGPFLIKENYNKKLHNLFGMFCRARKTLRKSTDCCLKLMSDDWHLLFSDFNVTDRNDAWNCVYLCVYVFVYMCI